VKRLLILSVRAGAGHTRVAEALEEAARSRWPAADVRHVDILDFTGSIYREGYVKSYLDMVNHAPELWGYLYRASDHRPRHGIQEKIVRLFDRLEFARFRRFVRDFRPEAVLASHFLAAQVFAPYRRRGRDRFPLGLVVTDFDVHAFWVQPTANRFFVATDELAARLSAQGIAAGKVSVTGIPVRGAFTRRRGRARERARLGLSKGRPVVLVMSGGMAVGSLADTARRILTRGKVQVLAVAGRNEKAREALRKVRAPRGSTLHAFGFVEDMASLMAASDVFVGKSGGSTTAECLAMGLPMIVCDPIPGQEERNCDFLLEAGAGVKAYGPASLSYKLDALLSDPAHLRRMRSAALTASHPDAASEVLKSLSRSSV
jgi:processive 1,2-diacylglycerol beta-glucosyltransferase